MNNFEGFKVIKSDIYESHKTVGDLDENSLYMIRKANTRGLCFTAVQANSTVGYIVNGTVDKDIYISYDGLDWTAWDGSQITLTNINDKVYVWNKKNTLNGYNNILNFNMSGLIAASGNCNSMINYGNLSDYCFHNLFAECTSLISMPSLPSITLAKSCYQYMFGRCMKLVSITSLPATALKQSCYYSMFQNCESLIMTPTLPATTLEENCYSFMFSYCTSLKQVADLPALTTPVMSYSGMFENCTSLVKGPNIYAKTMNGVSCANMFIDCSNLSSIKLVNYTKSFANGNNFQDWVKNVSSSGILYYNGSDTSVGTSAIPSGWTVQTF